MVLCIVALVVFGILGIFSAKYRKLAAQALDCTVKTVTLRPCDTGLDEKIKTKLIGTLLKISPAVAKFSNKHYNVLSKVAGILFFALFFGSLFFSAQSVYNYAVYGNCNGPGSTEFCAFDALLGKNTTNTPFVTPTVLSSDLKIGNPVANLTVIEFGCYTCPFTKANEGVRKQLVDKYKGEVRFVFKPFPLPNHNNSRELAAASLINNSWEFHDTLFELQKDFKSISKDEALAKLETLGVTRAEIENKTIQDDVEANFEQGVNAKIIGTPTYFIGNASFVNPSFNQMSQAIELALTGQTLNHTTAQTLGGSCPA